MAARRTRRPCVPISVLLAGLVAYRGPAPSVVDDGQWIMPGRDYSASRFSGLNEITAANAKNLRPTWSFYRRPRRSRGPATGSRFHHVRRHSLSQRALRLRPDQEGYPLRWKYRPYVDRRQSAFPAATS